MEQRRNDDPTGKTDDCVRLGDQAASASSKHVDRSRPLPPVGSHERSRQGVSGSG
jgi:hypothetical protein